MPMIMINRLLPLVYNTIWSEAPFLYSPRNVDATPITSQTLVHVIYICGSIGVFLHHMDSESRLPEFHFINIPLTVNSGTYNVFLYGQHRLYLRDK